MVDSKGILTTKRSKNGELNEYKDEFARDVATEISKKRWKIVTYF